MSTTATVCVIAIAKLCMQAYQERVKRETQPYVTMQESWIKEYRARQVRKSVAETHYRRLQNRPKRRYDHGQFAGRA